MAERNSEIPEDRRMPYRIGINLGDILIEGDDILGDGVNQGEPAWRSTISTHSRERSDDLALARWL